MIKVEVIKDGSNWYIITNKELIEIPGQWYNEIPYDLEKEFKRIFGIVDNDE
jgi:hypothetical protein